MIVHEHYPVRALTSMRAGGTARFCIFVKTQEELVEAVAFADKKEMRMKVLGAGSNSVLPDGEFDGVLVCNQIHGIHIEDKGDSVYVTAGAGEPWDAFVEKMVDQGFFGLENLSLIPGSVGAAPVQNIGAYGVEVASLIEGVEVYDTKTKVFSIRSARECAFDYRDSIFKQSEGKDLVVVRVMFRLQKEFVKNTSYPDLERWEKERGTLTTAQSVRDAVSAIRSAKLPDPRVVATAGSFWKNPVLCEPHALALKKAYPELPIFPAGEGLRKISLGWLLDHALDKKGIREGNVGLYEKQALALVSYGATQTEIDMFAKKIEHGLKEKFSIELEREVEFIS